MRRAAALLAVLLTVALLVPAANAAPAPDVVTIADADAAQPFVAVDGLGRATSVWTQTLNGVFVVQTRRTSADGIPGPTTTLSNKGLNSTAEALAIDSQGRAIVVWWSNAPDATVQAVRLSSSGAPGTVVTLSADSRANDLPHLAIDGQDRATVAWTTEGTNTRVQAIQLDAAFQPGPVRTLSAAGQDAMAPRVAIDGQDRATVVWQRSDGTTTRVQSVRLSATGTPGTTNTLSTAGQAATAPDVAVDSLDRATVVWYETQGTGSVVRTVRLSSGTTPGTPQTHTAAALLADAPRIAVDGSDRATIAWSRGDSGRFRVESRRLEASGTAGATQSLSPSGQRDGFGPELAVDHADRATVIWRLRENSLDRVQAVRLSADGNPGAVQTLSEAGQSAQAPRVDVDPRGRATVVWSLAPTLGSLYGAIQSAQLNVPAFDGPSCLISPTLVSAGSSTVRSIPDNDPSGIVDTISIDATGTIADVDVLVNISHTRSQDLDLTLSSPSGDTLLLSIGNGNGSQNFAGITFDDQASLGPVTDFAFSDATTPLALQPEGALAMFFGASPSGDWQLGVADNAVADAGTLVSWELAITTVTSPAPTPSAFGRSSASMAINDNATTTSTLTVSGAQPEIFRATLGTDITHTATGDLDIALTSPEGTTTTISTDNGGNADDGFANTGFGDFGAFPVTQAGFTDGTPVLDVQPEGAMAAFVGEDPNGTWILQVTDDTAGDVGTLRSWTIDVFAGCGTDPEPEPSPSPTDDPTPSPSPSPSPTTPTTAKDYPSADLIATAVAVSQDRFPVGASGRSSDFAVVSRDDVFADALGASVLLGDAPLLFTPTTHLDSRTEGEVTRLAVGTVYLLGGPNALSEGVADSLADLGVEVVRLAGKNRIVTSIAVADKAIELGISDGRTIALARERGEGSASWADSVSGGGYAASSGIPIILTPTAEVHVEVADFIHSRGVQSTILLGGPGALGAAVEAGVPDPTRVSGRNRFATAVQIARVLVGVNPSTAVRSYQLVDGRADNGWGYGMIAAGLAADAGRPILLVASTTPPETLAEVTGCDDQVTLVQLGPLDAGVVAQLRDADSTSCG